MWDSQVLTSWVVAICVCHLTTSRAASSWLLQLARLNRDCGVHCRSTASDQVSCSRSFQPQLTGGACASTEAASREA